MYCVYFHFFDVCYWMEFFALYFRECAPQWDAILNENPLLFLLHESNLKFVIVYICSHEVIYFQVVFTNNNKKKESWTVLEHIVCIFWRPYFVPTSSAASYTPALFKCLLFFYYYTSPVRIKVKRRKVVMFPGGHSWWQWCGELDKLSSGVSLRRAFIH